MDQAGKATEEVALSWHDDPCYDTSFGVAKSRRYHAMFRDFYRRCHQLALALTAFAGSAAFVSLLPANPNSALAKVLTAIVAFATISDLVVDFSKRADQHDALCRRFTELDAKIRAWDPPTHDHYRQACAERIRIEADEPNRQQLINIRAQNEEESARGVPLDRLLPLGFWQRSWLGYFFTFGEGGLRKRILKMRLRGQPYANEGA